MKFIEILILILIANIFATSCGGLAGGLAAIKVIDEIKEDVCPEYPGDPYCEHSEGTVIKVNNNICVATRRWADEMQDAYKECKSGNIYEKKVIPSELSEYCEARKAIFTSSRIERKEYRIKWQKTFYSYATKTKKFSYPEFNCKSTADFKQIKPMNL